jgi:hypothetical protein
MAHSNLLVATPSVQNRVFLACFFCTFQTKCPSMYRNDPSGRNSNFENPIDQIYVFGKSNFIGWLIQVSRPQTYVKRTFWGVAHRHSYWKNYVLKVTKVSNFTQKNRAVKLLPTLTVEGCSAQAQAFECLNSPHTPCCVSQLSHL